MSKEVTQLQIDEANELLKTANTPKNKAAVVDLEHALEVQELKKALQIAKDQKPEVKEVIKEVIKEVPANESNVDMATAISGALVDALEKQKVGHLRPVKQFEHLNIKCDEYIVNRSERDSSQFVVGERIRTGVQVTKQVMTDYNKAILQQSCAKVLIPVENTKDVRTGKTIKF